MSTEVRNVEVDEALSYARGPDDPAVLDETVGGLLRRIASASPDQLALLSTGDSRRWTYSELFADCEAAARGLLARFDPGTRIAIWAQNVPEWVLAEFALALAGLPIVTINPNLGRDEAAYILKQSGSRAVLASTAYRGRNLASEAAELFASCPELRDVIAIDGFGDFIETGRSMETELVDPDPGDLVMIQYTSGTTGFPKGAMLHHRGIVTNGYHTAHRNGTPEGCVMLGVMPLFHTGGSVLAVLGTVASAGALALVEEFEPGRVLDVVEQHRVTNLSVVPTMMVAMLEHPTYADRDLSSVAIVTSGGSTVPASLVEQIERDIGAPFTIVFGQTELSPVCNMTRPDDSIADKANTIGQPMPCLEIKIVDPAGNTVPHGVAGELCCRGYSVMIGYNDNPTATADTIDADGWLHTGDLATMDERGYCTIAGRLKDMIIRGGENIYPREIEELLFQHPAVGEAAVVGLPDPKWGEIVAAFIRPNGDVVPTAAELREFTREQLAGYKTPVAWFHTAEFPLTGSGKIQKFRLIEQWRDGETTAMAP